MQPALIGRYQIELELGRGGMSTVYLAHDPLFDRQVAIKLLPHELLHQPTYRQRFDQEAKILAALDHRAIVPVYDIGEEDAQPYVVMRYMTGGSLSEQIKQGVIEPKEAARILIRLAMALHEVHSHQILHRDLKPSNILFDQWNEPFLSDFGTAKSSLEEQPMTQTGMAVGTPAYMSPEQIQGAASLDHRGDIYAMGIILYEMLCGHHPYGSDTPIAVAIKHVTEPLPPLLETNPNLPPIFETIINKATEKNPDQRYQSAIELAEALQRIISPGATMEVAAMPALETAAASSTGEAAPDRPAQINAPTAGGLPGKLWLPAAGMALLLILYFGGGYFKNQQATKPTAAAATAALQVVAQATATLPPIEAAAAAEEVPAAAQVSTTSPTAPATATSTPTPTAMPLPTSTPPPTATEAILTAEILLESSLFSQPDAGSAERDIVRVGETVRVLGQGFMGQWLYVRSLDGAEGYVYGERVAFAGDPAALPTVVPPTSTPAACPNGQCARLTLDAYPLLGSSCEGTTISRTVYMRGHGGNQVYSYFWNGETLKAEVRDNGFSFTVDNSMGTPVIGMAKVSSGDGQSVELELYISDFSCD